MCETRKIIREILEHSDIDSLKRKKGKDLSYWLVNNFNISNRLAYYISNRLKACPSDYLYIKYFPELR